MKKIALILSFVTLLLSCSYEWPPPYVDFDEATAHIVEQYGQPAVVRDTVFYDDGTVRNRVVYWDIDPPEIVEEWVTVSYGEGSTNEHTYLVTTEYTTYYIEIWNQPYDDRTTINRYRQYGWEILRENKGTYNYVE